MTHVAFQHLAGTLVNITTDDVVLSVIGAGVFPGQSEAAEYTVGDAACCMREWCCCARGRSIAASSAGLRPLAWLLRRLDARRPPHMLRPLTPRPPVHAQLLVVRSINGEMFWVDSRTPTGGCDWVDRDM